MPVINPFLDNDAFNMISLTKAINILPNNYGRLRELNLFPGRGVTTRTIMVEEQNGVLNLLSTLPVGSPGQQGKQGKRKVRSFVIPHIPHDDVIMPEEFQGVRAFGSENQMQSLAQMINTKQQNMRNKHAITLEHLRMGALKGKILDADGSTLYNLYTEFGITPKVIDFELDDDTTDVAAKCREVHRHVEDNLLGEVSAGLHFLVSEQFFDYLIGHPNVEKFWLNHQQALQLAGTGGDPRKGFTFGGILWEEYRGKATDGSGNVRKFIADEHGHGFPVGTMSTFETLFAPADFNETVNTIGMEIYSKMEPRKMGRGMDLHSQSNPLPMCNRPGLLVEVKAK
jgi:hypothetical protein